MIHIYEPGHSSSYKFACAPSEDSDETAYPCNVIKVLSVRLKTFDYWLPTESSAMTDQTVRMRTCSPVGNAVPRLSCRGKKDTQGCALVGRYSVF